MSGPGRRGILINGTGRTIVKMIGLIDYGMGNLRSVYNAFESLGITVRIVREQPEVNDCSHLVLPGVGSYAAAMSNLRTRGLVSAIIEHVQASKPLLGICLGMQVLSSFGDEPHLCEGLGIIPGHVKLLSAEPPYRLPHVGWNTLELKRPHPVFSGLRAGIDVYFVHSYHFQTDREEDVLAVTEYSQPFASVVANLSVIGVQFHPEKSQNGGLQILERFSEWDGRC
jgi:glutamine amidotransferase